MIYQISDTKIHAIPTNRVTMIYTFIQTIAFSFNTALISTSRLTHLYVSYHTYFAGK